MRHVIRQLIKLFEPEKPVALGRWNSVVFKEHASKYSYWATNDHSLSEKKSKESK